MGEGSQRSQFLGFPSIYVYTLSSRTIKFDAVTHVGEMCVSWDQPRLPSQHSRVPALPNFRGSVVFMPTSFNAKLRNSAW